MQLYAIAGLGKWVDNGGVFDGVAGITHDAVAAGEEYTYRFVADQAGTMPSDPVRP